MQTQQNKPLPAREMHKIVLAMVGVFGLIAITYPMAMMRVSQMEKFRGYHVKSLPIDMKQPPGKLPDVQPVVSQSSVAAIASSSQVQSPSMSVATDKTDTQAVNLSNQTAEITDLTKLEVLNQKLFDQLDRNWKISPTFEHSLIYRVSVDDRGEIAGYEPLNQSAKDYVQETPLSDVPNSQNADAGINQAVSVGKFTVLFTPKGLLEVNR
jgi:hypothetical protein